MTKLSLINAVTPGVQRATVETSREWEQNSAGVSRSLVLGGIGNSAAVSRWRYFRRCATLYHTHR